MSQDEQLAASISQKAETTRDERGDGTSDGETGYRRPPRAHRFKPGLSGNPKGRPKGSKNEFTMLREIMDETKLPLREGARQRQISVREAILRRVTEDALKGNTKSAAFMLNRYAQMVSGEVGNQAISYEDQDILEAFTRSVLARQKGDS